MARELAHHEKLYSGHAQQIFSTPAVRLLRAHIVGRIVNATGVDRSSRILSLGCGIGDTELLLAPRVAHITGVDLSPTAIRQARAEARAAKIRNTKFVESNLYDSDVMSKTYDCVIGIFFLHHVPDTELADTVKLIHDCLKPGGVYYGLDPNRYRLSGAIGSLVVPQLMRKYQTPDERELPPSATADLFRSAGLDARSRTYDFCSSPVAGLFQQWPSVYRFTRAADEVLIRIPLLKLLGSNFELIAKRP